MEDDMEMNMNMKMVISIVLTVQSSETNLIEYLI